MLTTDFFDMHLFLTLDFDSGMESTSQSLEQTVLKKHMEKINMKFTCPHVSYHSRAPSSPQKIKKCWRWRSPQLGWMLSPENSE